MMRLAWILPHHLRIKCEPPHTDEFSEATSWGRERVMGIFRRRAPTEIDGCVYDVERL
jgi:hypothetical protein